MKSCFKSDTLRGKSAFITGGATGICYGIAQTFLQHGCQVSIASRKIANIESAVKSLKSQFPTSNIFGFSCDVRKPEQVQDAVTQAIQKMGTIDILINGAAGNFLSSFNNLSINAFKTVIQIDTLGTFIVTKVVYDKALKNKGGVIINISASLYYNGCALQTHAGTAKAGVDAMTKHLAVELGPRGVRVVGICPGPIEATEGMERLSIGRLDERVIPLQRSGKKSEIGDAALFLSSEAAAFITGTTLVVDGGQSLTIPNMPFANKEFIDGYSKL